MAEWRIILDRIGWIALADWLIGDFEWRGGQTIKVRDKSHLHPVRTKAPQHWIALHWAGFELDGIRGGDGGTLGKGRVRRVRVDVPPPGFDPIGSDPARPQPARLLAIGYCCC